MSAQPLPYELVLLGFLQGPDLYEQVSRRLAASSLAGARDFELEELICVRQNANVGNEENKLRLRRLLCAQGAESEPWSMINLQRPLSVREYPNVGVRGLVICPIASEGRDGDGRQGAIELASSLGFKQHSSLRKRGYLFSIGQGPVNVFLYQLYAPAEAAEPAQPTDQWLIEVQLMTLFHPPAAIPPTRPGQAAPPPPQPTKLLADVLQEGIGKVEEVRSLLRGLVTLQRVDV